MELLTVVSEKEKQESRAGVMETKREEGSRVSKVIIQRG